MLNNKLNIIGLIYFIYINKITYLFYFNKNKLLGQDRQFILDKDIEYSNYPTAKYLLEKNHSNLYEFIRNKYKIELNNKKSNLRIYQSNKNKYKFKYSNIDSDKILDCNLEKVEDITLINEREIINKTNSTKNKWRIVIANNGFIFTASHLFYDGISIHNIVNTLICNGKKIKLLKYKYFPIFNELMILNNILKNMNLYKKLLKKNNLSYDYDWRKDDIAGLAALRSDEVEGLEVLLAARQDN